MGPSSHRRFISFPLLVCLFVLALAGCSEERPPINRVQANALSKSFFVGDLLDPADDPEFYGRVTVVEAQSGAGNDGLFTSSDAQPTTRIRWEITESVLFARLTYDLVDNTSGKGARRTPHGQVVAAYAIQKHFDIRRDYNDSTGEEANVIVENDTDLPWSQRQYFRVDWSANLVTDAYELDTLSQLGIYYGVKWDPIAYYVSDPDDPDAPFFDPERGYFDITNRAFASPEIIEDEYWGDFPACWLIGALPATSCNPSEVTLRLSYLKIQDTDYEPLHFDGTRMDMFGYFTVDRFGFDPIYGYVDDQWRRFATRWNLYEKSHAETPCAQPETLALGDDPNRDIEPLNGTEDECEEVGRGSRCDVFKGLCTLPLRDRAIRVIPWYTNEDHPEELFATSNEAMRSWSSAMRVAVLAGRLAECRRTGETSCESAVGWPAVWSDDFVPPLDRVPEIFILCHNPVDPEKGDVPECGEAGTRVRLGDLRFNMLNVITTPQDTGPWGIMADAEDPLTGEKIAGSVNEWGHVLDRNAGNLADLIAVINGEIPATDYIAGYNVSEWVFANQPGGSAERAAPMSAPELESRKGAFDQKVIAPLLAGLDPKPIQPGAKIHPKAKRQQRLQALVDQGRLGPGNDALLHRLTRLRGTSLEATMVSGEVAQASGFDPTQPLSPDALKAASPFGRRSPALGRFDRKNLLTARASRHSCRVEAPEADNLLGLARAVAAKFPSPDPNDPAAVNEHRKAVILWARQELHRGVIAHEIGHSMGLRHNFAASFDSLNYEAGYWQLRTNNGETTAECDPGNTDGAACVGPRYNDPLTAAEMDGNLQRYATTSVMDYPGDQNQDTLLPGKYDRAAVRFGYGGVVDVWNDTGVSVDGTGPGQETAFELTALTTSPGIFGVYYFPPVDPGDDYKFIHYSQYQKKFNLISDCQADTSPDAVLGKKCAGAPLDVVDYRDMYDFVADPDYEQFSWAVNARAVDELGRVRRGYMFSSDEYSDAGNVPSFSTDAGADAYEQIRFLEGAYENRYILESFRRNRIRFNSWDVTARIQYKYLDSIQQLAKTFAFAAVLDGDPLNPSIGFEDDGLYGPLGVGSSVALDLFARILTRPEPGHYYEQFAPYGVTRSVYSADPVPQPDLYLYDYEVALGDGRYLHNDYDYSQGYWWGDYQTQVGTYYDKIWANYYLAEAFDGFISNSKEDFTDSRYKNVNFATVYPEQVRRLYAALLTNDYDTYAPWVKVPAEPDTTPLGTLQYPSWHDLAGPAPRPAGVKLADPNYAWNEQMYAMVWGAMFFPTNWSAEWVHDARIAISEEEAPSWPANEVYAFFDPKTGITYRSHTSGTEVLFGETRQRSVGARMLEWANRLLTFAYVVETDAAGDPLLNPDGTPQLTLDADGKAQKNTDNPGADLVLQKYVDTIEILRQLTATFEQPLNEEDLPQP